MRATLIATGKCKDKEILSLCAEYLKRLQAFFPTTVVEVPQTKADRSEDIKAGEAKAQLAKIPDGAYVIALDEHGKNPTTRAFASKIEQIQLLGKSELVFIIGGSDGLHSSVLQRADFTLSLSALTFPHMMVRPIILEQLYRAGTVLAGHPYHRD